MILPRFLAMLLAATLLVGGSLRPDLLPPDLLSGDAQIRDALLQAALCFLLFTAAMHLRAGGPFRQLAMATWLSVTASALTILILGWASRWVFGRLGLDIPLSYCFLFAALVAPADPLAMLRTLVLGGATPDLGRRAVAEPFVATLVGIACFSAVLAKVDGSGARSAFSVLLVQEAGGGVLLGACLGLLALYILRHDARSAIAVPVSLVVIAASALSGEALGLSGPIAAGVAGLVLAMQREGAFGERDARDRMAALALPWAEIVTAALLLWLAFELVSRVQMQYVGAAVFVLPVVVVVRATLTGGFLWLFARGRSLPEELPKTVAWGGVRGGIAAALALSLPAGDATIALQTAVFVVLGFSLVLQAPLHGLALVSSKPLAAPPPRDPDEENGSDPSA